MFPATVAQGLNTAMAQGQMMLQSFMNAQAVGIQNFSSAIQQGQSNFVNSVNSMFGNLGNVASGPFQQRAPPSPMMRGAGFSPSGFFPNEMPGVKSANRGTGLKSGPDVQVMQGGVGMAKVPKPATKVPDDRKSAFF